MSQSPFQKFIGKKKNSVIKETFRQEKKKAKKERAAFFEKKKKEEFEARNAKRAAQQTIKGKQPATRNPQPASPAGRPVTAKPKPQTSNSKPETTGLKPDSSMPLNKYLAHCGVCSRRDAVALIAAEKVKVNGKIVTEPGYKVQHTDEVIFNGKKLFVTKNLVYILLNKPKDYITTTDDPQGRKTVLQLIQHATAERVYPIGRLDRNTSGVLLLTNDGDLTQKLSHPSYEIKKIYEAKLDKPLVKADFDKILKGLKLEDGLIHVDSLAYADSKDKSIIGIEIHSGRNRIVRRIFEHLGYDVKGLDRVMYANLTKKNVERGKWRYLSEKEIRLLKYMNAGKKK
ncbi:MAG TPA: pseudouridine synthase [Ferruginibacter sp.]|nr:pseudouridine synthase [Ferruginibacter sp.]